MIKVTQNTQWIPVPGWEQWYDVSEFGHLRTRRSTWKYPKGRIVKPVVNNCGYVIYQLRDGKRVEQWCAHKIVLLAFHGQPPLEKTQGNHKDGNKSNNHFSNLEYVTPSENQTHAYKTGLNVPRAGEQHNNAILTESQALQILRARGTIAGTDLAKQFNVSTSTVSAIWHKRIWRHLPDSPPKPRSLADRNRETVVSLFQKLGDKTAVARLVGISPTLVFNIIKRHQAEVSNG